MPIFRTLHEILNDPDTNDAERRLLDECVTGEVVVFGEGVPSDEDTDRCIRASIIAYLMRGGCALHRVHEKGVLVRGAWVLGSLNIDSCESGLALELEYCYISGPISLIGAHLSSAILDGSLVAEADDKGAAICAHGLATKGRDFQPQPYQQLAKVLREMGHEDDARIILMEKERLQRKDRLRRMSERIDALVVEHDAAESGHAAQSL